MRFYYEETRQLVLFIKHDLLILSTEYATQMQATKIFSSPWDMTMYAMKMAYLPVRYRVWYEYQWIRQQ